MLFRINTEQEFLDEFGTDWRRMLRYKWVSPDMDHLFNTQIDFNGDDIWINGDRIFWHISSDMVSALVMIIDEDGNTCK